MYRSLRYSLPVPLLLILGQPACLSAEDKFAVATPFVESAKDTELSPRQKDMLSAIQQIPTSQDVKVVRVNAQALKESDQVSIPLRNYSISIQTNSREVREGKVIFWSGTAPREVPGSTSIVVNGENVTASIQSTDGLYRIRPLGNGLHALFKVDSARFPKEHPPSPN